MLKNVKRYTFVLVGALTLSSCLPLNEQKKSDCSSGQTYSSTLRRCLSNDEIAGITGSNHLPQAYGDESVAAFAEGAFTTFNVQPGSDEDGDSLTYIITADPSYGTITNCMNKAGSSGGTDLSCTYTPDIEHAGTDSFSYKVHDGHSYSASAATITFSITGADDAPTTTSPADASIDEDTVINLYYDVDEGGGVDEDTQSVSFTIENTSANLPAFLDGDGEIKVYWGATLVETCTDLAADCVATLGDGVSSADSYQVRVMITLDSNENQNHNGVFDVDITVDDGALTVTDSASFTILPYDDNPDLAAIANPAAVNEDTALGVITLSVGEGGDPNTGALDADEDTTNVSVTISSSNTSLVNPEGANVTLTCDGGGLTIAGNATMGSDGVWDLNADLLGNCVTASDLDAATVVLGITPEPGAYGTAVITVSAADTGGNTTVQTFTVTVNEVNDAPELWLDDATTDPVEGTDTFTMDGEDPNGNATTIACVVGDYAGPVNSTCSFDENETLDLDFVVDEDAISTNDSSFEDDQSLKIYITSSDTNILPYSAITVYYAGTNLGSPTDNTTAISLGDGSSNASASIPSDGTDNGLTIKVSPESNGAVNLTILVEDYDSSGVALGTTTTHTVALTVNDINMAPEIDAIADQEANEGLPINKINLTGISEGRGDTPETMTFSIFDRTFAEENDGTSDCSLDATDLSNYNDALIVDASVLLYTDEGTNSLVTNLRSASNAWGAGIMNNGGAFSVADYNYWLSVDPVNGQTGVSCVGITLTDAAANATTVYFKVTVNAVSVAFVGWEEIMSVGDKVDAYGTELAENYIYLEWEPYIMVGSSISGYNVYCSKDSALTSFDFSAPLNSSVISSAVYEFDTRSTAYDSTHECLTSGEWDDGQAYYFVVAALDAANNITGSSDSVANLRVIVPPNNMSLVHRYMANKEMCELLEQTPDVSNGFRCTLDGFGGVAIGGTNYYDYYDGADYYDLLVDTYEAGCPYTLPTAGTCDYNGNGCIGNVAPDDALFTGEALGDIYYNRANGKCYVRDGAASWLDLAGIEALYVPGTDGNISDGGTDTFYKSYYNSPKLPPLTHINSYQAWNYCQADAVSILEDSLGTVISGAAIQKRLPNRKEFIAMAAWDPDLSDASIDSIESGGSLDTNQYCNGQTNNGLTYVSSDAPTSAFWDTLPSTVGWGEELVATGSDATSDCVSRYGIQDLVGNVAEYSIEVTDCTLAGLCTSQNGRDGTVWQTFNALTYDFDGNPGPMDSVSLDNITMWDWDDESYSANYIYPAYGLPATTSTNTLAIGPAIGGITATQFHGDRIALYSDSVAGDSGNATFVNGGNYESESDNAGRWTLGLVGHNTGSVPASNAQRYGFRCLARIPY